MKRKSRISHFIQHNMKRTGILWRFVETYSVQILPRPFRAVHLVVKLFRHNRLCVIVIQVCQVHCQQTNRHMLIILLLTILKELGSVLDRSSYCTLLGGIPSVSLMFLYRLIESVSLRNSLTTSPCSFSTINTSSGLAIREIITRRTYVNAKFHLESLTVWTISILVRMHLFNIRLNWILLQNTWPTVTGVVIYSHCSCDLQSL